MNRTIPVAAPDPQQVQRGKAAEVCNDPRPRWKVKADEHQFPDGKSDLTLPKDVYERAERAAADEKRQLGELLSGLVAEGLEARVPVRQLLEQVSAQYRARLAGEGKLEQAPEEVLEELRRLREQVARELYP